LNIAEGNGKHTSADRCRYFDIARGSAIECTACLDVLIAKKKIDEDKLDILLFKKIAFTQMLGAIKKRNQSINFGCKRENTQHYDAPTLYCRCL
jgi:four helix bundle protein